MKQNQKVRKNKKQKINHQAPRNETKLVQLRLSTEWLMAPVALITEAESSPSLIAQKLEASQSSHQTRRADFSIIKHDSTESGERSARELFASRGVETGSFS